LSCLTWTWTCITSLVQQQFTRQLITARVQVNASTLPPHTSATHFKETCISLQPWREANVYTVTQSPACPPASSSFSFTCINSAKIGPVPVQKKRDRSGPGLDRPGPEPRTGPVQSLVLSMGKPLHLPFITVIFYPLQQYWYVAREILLFSKITVPVLMWLIIVNQNNQ